MDACSGPTTSGRGDGNGASPAAWMPEDQRDVRHAAQTLQVARLRWAERVEAWRAAQEAETVARDAVDAARVEIREATAAVHAIVRLCAGRHGIDLDDTSARWRFDYIAGVLVKEA